MTDRGTLSLPFRLIVFGGIAAIIAGVFVPYGNVFGNSIKLLYVTSTTAFRDTVSLAIEPFVVAIALGVLALMPSAGRRAAAAIAGLGGVAAVFFLSRVLNLIVSQGGSVHYLRAGAFIGLAGGVVVLVAGVIGSASGDRVKPEPRPVQPVQHQAIAPAGWYPDPTGQARERFWDGQQWGEATR